MQCVAGNTRIELRNKASKKKINRGQIEYIAQRDPLKHCRLPLMSTHVAQARKCFELSVNKTLIYI